MLALELSYCFKTLFVCLVVLEILRFGWNPFELDWAGKEISNYTKSNNNSFVNASQTPWSPQNPLWWAMAISIYCIFNKDCFCVIRFKHKWQCVLREMFKECLPFMTCHRYNSEFPVFFFNFYGVTFCVCCLYYLSLPLSLFFCYLNAILLQKGPAFRPPMQPISVLSLFSPFCPLKPFCWFKGH